MFPDGSTVLKRPGKEELKNLSPSSIYAMITLKSGENTPKFKTEMKYMHIGRDRYLNQLISRRENGLIRVITGIRCCGKSYLLFRIFYDYLLSHGVKEEQIIALALDDDTNAIYRDPAELSKFIRSKITDKETLYYIMTDEAQYAIAREELRNPGEIKLYDVLNGLLRLRNVDIYVTGSNSKMLSRDVMTEFRGRGDAVEVYPLSFKEYYDFIGGDKSDAYEEYALYGGMPLVISKKTDEEKFKYLSTLFTEVYFKDIVERYKIEMEDVLGEITDDLCSSVGSLTNAAKIANTLQTVKNIKVAGPTISKYLEESYLFKCARRYDVKGKKYYCTDIGLRNVRLNLRQQEETHIMENIIYNELILRGYSVDVGVVEIQERDESGNRHKTACEIDFVVNKGAKKYYIQSALNMADPAKAKRELRPLLSTRDFFKKIVVSKTSMKPWIDEDGISHLGLYDFLLNENLINM